MIQGLVHGADRQLTVEVRVNVLSYPYDNLLSAISSSGAPMPVKGGPNQSYPPVP